MSSSLYLHMFLILCCFNLSILTNSYSSTKPLCHEGERSALLQFKDSFFIKEFASVDPSAYPKAVSWKLDGNISDCCSWDGVECDHDTGHVVGLDLSSSFLYGSINSNSSLFSLVHLQRLNLDDNHFNYSQIPTSIGNLSTIRSLNLYNSFFSGTLPSEYFQNWNAMKVAAKGNSTYMQVVPIPRSFGKGDISYLQHYTYSVTISSKGTKRSYEKIQSVFVVVDLSNNIFSGKIPESLGNLRGLQLLNISKNNLTGVIPSSFASLTDLESLDMSQNLLSGEIPEQLTQLTFLSVLNLSHNRLTGPIPHGKQFDTFDNSSYGGNMGLCGVPLTMLCGTSETSPPPAHSSQGTNWEFSIGIYWMVIILGYGSGVIVGLVIGHTLTTRYHERFVAIFERGKKTKKMQKRKGRRN